METHFTGEEAAIYVPRVAVSDRGASEAGSAFRVVPAEMRRKCC